MILELGRGSPTIKRRTAPIESADELLRRGEKGNRKETHDHVTATPGGLGEVLRVTLSALGSREKGGRRITGAGSAWVKRSRETILWKVTRIRSSRTQARTLSRGERFEWRKKNLV